MDRPTQHINDKGLLAVDSIGVPLAYWDNDLICRFANNALEEWFGKTREELVDKLHLKELLGPLYEKNFSLILETLKGKPQRFEREIKMSSGAVRHAIINYYPDFQEGIVRGFTVHLVDITEQKKAEEALHISEEKYKSLVNLSPAGITLSTVEGKPLEVNQAVLDIYGYDSKEEFLTTPIWEHYVDRNDRIAFVELVKKEGTINNFEVRQKKKNGAIIWISNDVHTYRLPDGEMAILKHSTDITDRKKILKELEESKEKFQKAFQASAAGIAIINLTDLKYVEVNKAFSKMVGHPIESLLGHTSTELGIVVDLNKREEALNTIKKMDTAKVFEMSLRHKSGKIIDVLSSVETLSVNDVKYAISIVYDITQRKISEQQLEAVNKELEAFTYSVSHDLRAPLRAVNGYAQMLKEEYGTKLDSEGNRIIETLCNNAVNMGTLIDELLSFSKLGRKEVLRTKINMNELVASVIKDIDKSYTNKATITIGKLHFIEADYAMIRQVMFNLFTNALKYSSKKEHPVVALFSEEHPGEIIFTIKDNGVGFDMKYYDKLFGVFQRLHKQSEFEGIGVGLAIVQRVIAKHEGRVWAEGKINEGAVFKFSIKTN